MRKLERGKFDKSHQLFVKSSLIVSWVELRKTLDLCEVLCEKRFVLFCYIFGMRDWKIN